MNANLEALYHGDFECIRCGFSFPSFDQLCIHIDECFEHHEIDEIEEWKKYEAEEEEIRLASEYCDLLSTGVKLYE